MMHIIHTCLMKVVLREKARAIFVVAHPFMTDTSVHFHNDKFKPYANGKYVIASFRCTTTRRHLIRVISDETIKSPEDFSHKYAKTLQQQMLDFNTWVSKSSVEIKEKWGALAKSMEAAAPAIEKAAEAMKEASDTLDKTLKSAAVSKEDSYRDYKPTNKLWIDNTFVDGPIATVFEAAHKLAGERPVKLLMTGPSGYGKTTIPEAYAKEWKLDFLRMNCAVVRDPEEWYGWREARDGSTVFVETNFTQAVRKGNVLIVLDELNRVEPWLHNSLFDLFDHAAQTSVHGETIKCGPNIVFVGTINLGAQFTGTFAMDAAMRNRIDAFIPVSPLEKIVEIEVLTKKVKACGAKLATLIVVAMREIRQVVAREDLDIDCSTRTSLKVAELVSVGQMPIRSAFAATIIDMLDTEGQKLVTDAIADIISK